jgi:hypothetical protein
VKKILVCLLLLGLLSLPGAVYAADWVQVPARDSYIDSESVVTKGELLWFWELSVDPDTRRKRLIQYAVRLPEPYRISSYWGWRYTADNRPSEPLLHTHSLPEAPGELLTREITMARTYAKTGERSDVLPALPAGR